MALAVEIWEKSGAGGTSELATNVNFKNYSGVDSLYKYYQYPVRRPTGDTLYNVSYQQVIYGKFSGTYAYAKRPRWSLGSGILANKGRIYYALSNTYPGATPLLRSDLTLVTQPYLFPNISSTSPEAATSYIQTLSGNTTYYTQYLILQLYINQDTFVGNMPDDDVGFACKLEVDEFETY
jgi:hypothetical protein